MRRATHPGWAEVPFPAQHPAQLPGARYAPVTMPVGSDHHASHLRLHHPHHQAQAHPQAHPQYRATNGLAATIAPTVHMQQLLEQQAAEQLRKSAKRAANRRSASTCRARKKFLVENMAEANSRMRKRSRVLSLLPDMILAMRRDGVVTYASENCQQFLKFSREEVQGANMFDIVEAGSHERLRRLLEDNLGSVSKDAIASALRHQGITFEDLLARSEKAKEQGDSHFFSGSAEGPRAPSRDSAKASPRSSGIANLRRTPFGVSGGGGTSACGDGSTDDWESELTSSACDVVGSSGSGSNGNGNGQRRVSSGGGSDKKDDALFSGSRKDEWAESGKMPKAVTATASAAKMRPEREETVEGMRLIGGARAVAGGASTATSTAASASDGRGDGGRFLNFSSDASMDGSIASNLSVVDVDRDLQSKINAFTNNQKELCKLEIIRQDKKSDWYEIRTSMRLVWLKTKQEIVPVEVICSCQHMHCDGPAGSANSIVDRLQRAAAMGRFKPAHSKICIDYLSGQSASSGFSASGESNDAGGSGDLSSEGDTNSCGSVQAVSSTDYGGGASSGTLSGESVTLYVGEENNSIKKDASRYGKNNSRRPEEGNGGGSVDAQQAPTRKRSRVVGPPDIVFAPSSQDGPKQASPMAVARVGQPSGGGQRAMDAGGVAGGRDDGDREGGRLNVGGHGGGGNDGRQRAVDFVRQEAVSRQSTSTGETAGAEALADSSRVLSPTVRRLAMSAKKTLLLRHGFDSQAGQKAATRA